MAFVRATKAKAKARVALIGPAGSGKTYTALLIARGLVGPEGRVAVIDTERGSASKYADDVTAFDTAELGTFSPADYVRVIAEAGAAGYDALVIDSLSHAWAGKGGALEMVDTAAKRSKSGSSFSAWREVTPEHHKLVDAILAAPCHVVVTMRAKTEYVQEKDANGRTVVRKVGLAPVQRDGVEYEFDVVGDLDNDHTLVITKSRCSALADGVFKKPGADLAGILRGWLSDGVTDAERPKPPPSRADALVALLADVSDGDALAQAKAEAKAAWRVMSAAEQGRVAAAVKAAEAAVAGNNGQAADAAAAEE